MSQQVTVSVKAEGFDEAMEKAKALQKMLDAVKEQVRTLSASLEKLEVHINR